MVADFQVAPVAPLAYFEIAVRGAHRMLVVANQIPTPAPTATTAAAEMMAGLLVNHFLRLGLTYASLAPRSPAPHRVKPSCGRH